jgi:hypothetical protein
MVTFNQIKSNLEDVTSTQIGKCTKVWDYQNHEDFYLVENSKEECDEHGIIEYPVRYSEEHGFTCGCKSGQVAFSNVKHPSGVCWHVRAAVACFLEEEAAMQEMAEAQAKVRHNAALPAVKLSRTEAAMPAWIMNARPASHMRKAPREV